MEFCAMISAQVNTINGCLRVVCVSTFGVVSSLG